MEGQLLTDLFKGREAQLEGFKKQMTGLMAEQGLEYGDRNKTYNSRLAQELGCWADSQANGEEVHKQLYRAYFVDNLNISDPELLVSLVEKAGLDSDAARKVLAERSFSDSVDQDWSRAHSYGVTGVPTFVSAGLSVVGCQPYELLTRFSNHLKALKRDTAD
ncbi:MAG: putative DsbA family dithiol-disulfide isomerase [Candidatus Azotimanducaceae bacterium]|jgi:predicted DsbA family dithiol-disulfide isomerase